MLARERRLTSAEDFSRTVRRGRRCGSERLVVHGLSADSPSDDEPTGFRAGMVVSKAVGPAVTRNRVKRRLRHLMADYERQAPHQGQFDGLLVLRALPPSAEASYAELRADLERCLGRLARPRPAQGAVTEGSR